MQKAYQDRHNVASLSVCLSVTFVSCDKAAAILQDVMLTPPEISFSSAGALMSLINRRHAALTSKLEVKTPTHFEKRVFL